MRGAGRAKRRGGAAVDRPDDRARRDAGRFRVAPAACDVRRQGVFPPRAARLGLRRRRARRISATCACSMPTARSCRSRSCRGRHRVSCRNTAARAGTLPADGRHDAARRGRPVDQRAPRCGRDDGRRPCARRHAGQRLARRRLPDRSRRRTTSRSSRCCCRCQPAPTSMRGLRSTRATTSIAGEPSSRMRRCCRSSTTAAG